MIKDNKITWINWVEPFNEQDDPVYCKVTEHAAILRQKEVAKKRGYTYPNDEEALLDFISVHWATVTEEIDEKIF